MPNTDPIYGSIYRSGIGVRLTTGAATRDGSNPNQLLFTANATNGSYLRRLSFMHAGTNVQTLLLVYKALGGANFRLLKDFQFAAYTLSNTVSSNPPDLTLNLGLGPGEQIWVQLATTVAGGIDVTAEVMDL